MIIVIRIHLNISTKGGRLSVGQSKAITRSYRCYLHGICSRLRPCILCPTYWHISDDTALSLLMGYSGYLFNRESTATYFLVVISLNIRWKPTNWQGNFWLTANAASERLKLIFIKHVVNLHDKDEVHVDSCFDRSYHRNE